MKAVILERQAPIEDAPLCVVDLPDPEPGPGEVRVRVHVCAICRTDLHVIEGDLPDPLLPLVPGHQVVGTVDRLGPGCTLLHEGQRVGIAWLRHTCGTCKYCRRGQENLCPESRYTGYHAHGGYAEYATVPEAFAYPLPAAFSDADAAPLLCAGIIGYRALQRADLPAGGRLGLFGFGSSAHVVLQLARHRGAHVVAVSRGAGHQQHAHELGAEWAGEDAAALPDPLDAAILFAPVGTLVPPALEALDAGGTLAIAGIHLTDTPPLNYQRHLFHEKTVRSVEANTRADGHGLLREAAAIPLRPSVTPYPLAEANRALQDLKADRINGTGVLVVA